MDKSQLKELLCQQIESRSAEIIASGEKLLRMPELSYKEVKTSAFASEFLESRGLEVKKEIAVTGLRADFDTGRPGPRVAILGGT